MAYATTAGGYTAEMAQALMLACVEYYFQSDRTSHPVEWFTDNGSCFKAYEIVSFGKSLGMECRFTPVVKNFKRDYVFNHPRDTAHTVLSQLDDGYFFSREFIRSQRI